MFLIKYLESQNKDSYFLKNFTENYNFFVDLDYKDETELTVTQIESICKIICDKVNKLIIIDKITYAGNKDNIKNISNKSNVILIEEDIIYHNFQKTYCDYNINYIVHLAGETHVDKSYSCLKNFIDNNIKFFSLYESFSTENINKREFILDNFIFGDIHWNKKGNKKVFNQLINLF